MNFRIGSLQFAVTAYTLANIKKFIFAGSIVTTNNVLILAVF